MNMRLIAIGLTATLALAGCASTSPGYSSGYGGGYNTAPANRYCADCGIVERIDVVPSGRSAPSATGAVLGGIVGAVAGRQISDRTGGSEATRTSPPWPARSPAQRPATRSRTGPPAIPTTSPCAWTTAVA